MTTSEMSRPDWLTDTDVPRDTQPSTSTTLYSVRKHGLASLSSHEARDAGSS